MSLSCSSSTTYSRIPHKRNLTPRDLQPVNNFTTSKSEPAKYYRIVENFILSKSDLYKDYIPIIYMKKITYFKTSAILFLRISFDK